MDKVITCNTFSIVQNIVGRWVDRQTYNEKKYLYQYLGLRVVILDCFWES